MSDPRLVFEGSEFDGPCQQLGPWDLGGSQRDNVSDDLTTVSDGTAARIRPNGSFSLSMALTRGRVSARLRLFGRFVGSGRTATGTFSDASSRADKLRCAKRGSFTVRFTGQRHLTVGSCPPSRTRTLADDGVIRVYEERYVYDPVIPGRANGGAVYGCNPATGQRWFLAPDAPSDGYIDHYECGESLGKLATAGALALFSVDGQCTNGAATDRMRIVDVSTGTLRLDAEPRVAPFPVGFVESVALAPTGSAAWTVCQFQGHTCQVVDETAYGPNTVLDQGDQIEPESLTLDGTTLSWTQQRRNQNRDLELTVRTATAIAARPNCSDSAHRWHQPSCPRCEAGKSPGWTAMTVATPCCGVGLCGGRRMQGSAGLLVAWSMAPGAWAASGDMSRVRGACPSDALPADLDAVSGDGRFVAVDC